MRLQIIFDEMDPEAIVQFNALLNDMITDDQITIMLIIESLTESLAACKNVSVTPMISHVGLKNITPLLNVLSL